MDSVPTGTLAGTGSFRCLNCGYVLSLATADALPPCPSCGGERYARASLFTASGVPDGPSQTSPPDESEPWLRELRAELDSPGRYVAYQDGNRVVVVALQREWTRLGRSLAADVRFDDPTVSRRHALIVRQPDGVRLLDDRSLNGVFVNGERVEWAPLRDGDELLIGRHRLRYLEVAGSTASEPELGAGAPTYAG
jgi:pSer/pThr/pTyr-binding forkhead associated (FHA) protein